MCLHLTRSFSTGSEMPKKKKKHKCSFKSSGNHFEFHWKFFLIFSESTTENIISRNIYSPIFCYYKYYCSLCLTNSDIRDQTEELSDHSSTTVLVVDPLLFAQSGNTELRHKINQFEDHLTFNPVFFNAFLGGLNCMRS